MFLSLYIPILPLYILVTSNQSINIINQLMLAEPLLLIFIDITYFSIPPAYGYRIHTFTDKPIETF